jgi:hypothetical protein
MDSLFESNQDIGIEAQRQEDLTPAQRMENIYDATLDITTSYRELEMSLRRPPLLEDYIDIEQAPKKPGNGKTQIQAIKYNIVRIGENISQIGVDAVTAASYKIYQDRNTGQHMRYLFDELDANIERMEARYADTGLIPDTFLTNLSLEDALVDLAPWAAKLSRNRAAHENPKADATRTYLYTTYFNPYFNLVSDILRKPDNAINFGLQKRGKPGVQSIRGS